MFVVTVSLSFPDLEIQEIAARQLTDERAKELFAIEGWEEKLRRKMQTKLVTQCVRDIDTTFGIAMRDLLFDEAKKITEGESTDT